jgi:prolipoprotein diacylglyceryltransferase
MLVHTIFDMLAAVCAGLVTYGVFRWRLQSAGERIERLGMAYAVTLVAGAAVGGFVFGTLNLWLSGVDGIGRSILGALAGAIIAIEVFKKLRGVRGSTGLLFVPAFASSVSIGGIVCFLSGVEDQTHGVASTVAWAHDFGDGVLRHPVQLYESAAMSLFLVFALVQLGRRDGLFMANGFYLLVGWYAVQRFCWEFLKPYGAVVGPFNIFHFLCAGLLVYAAVMIKGNRSERASS